MIATFFDDMNLTNTILVLGVLGVVVKTIGEGRGWFRSSASLRVENTDLLRRNTELEGTVARHEKTLASNDIRILALEQTIRELEKLDQSAVLEQLRAHEVGAIGRATVTHALQVETNTALERIASILETQPEGVAA